MDLDIEHTAPALEYLARARLSVLSIEESSKSKLSNLQKKAGDQNGFSKDGPPGFPKGKFIKDPNAPDDKGNFVLITIALIGLVQMLPFLFFLTANEYWMYKFRNTTSESTDANDRTSMQSYFSSLNSVVVTMPGVICNFIAAIGGHKIKATTRVFFVLFVHSCILMLQTVFVMVDTDTWQVGFLIFTLASQLVMSCAISLGGSGVMGLISKLPPYYIKAQLIGEGGGSVFSAVLRLVSIMLAPSTTGAALIYFVTGSLLMISTSIVFFFATRTQFFKFYTSQGSIDAKKEKLRNYKDIGEVLKIIWPMILTPLITMLVPVTSITNLVVSEYNGTDNVWGDKYFVTVCTYLIPAITGLIGRALFNSINFDLPIPVIYVIEISRAAILGILFFLSNAKPRHHLPVIVNRDWEYAIVAAVHSLLCGFLMNLSIMKVMRMVPRHRIELTMMINMFFISIFAASTSPLGVLAVSLL